LAKRKGVSIEMAAREVRHRFLAQTARKRRCPFIAMAHHADDQAELVLLRLLRGSGSEGLGGMRACSPSPMDADLTLIRPLLAVRREEILTFAQKHRIRFREDRSNASRVHLRNRVRHELLPHLRKHHQPAIESVLCRTASILAEEADYIEDVARQWLADGGGPFNELPLALRRRLIQLQALDLGVPLDFESVEQLVDLPERRVSVPGGQDLVRQLDGRVALATDRHYSPLKDALVLSVVDAGEVQFGRLGICWKTEPVPSGRPSARVSNQ